MMAVSIEEQTRKTLQTYFEMPRIQSFSVRRIDLQMCENVTHHIFCIYVSSLEFDCISLLMFLVHSFILIIRSSQKP